MEAELIFKQALGLSEPWYVESIDLDEEARRLTIALGWERGSRFPARGGDGAPLPVHDSEERRWRHLNFFEYETELVAKLPRVKGEDGKVTTAEVPWARAGSGFTLLMEAFLMELAAHMPISALARIVGEHDTRVWRVVRHHVGAAQADSSWEGEVGRLGVDETSTKKGHCYATVFVGVAGDGTGRLLHMEEGKNAAAVGRFAAAMGEHGAAPGEVGSVAIDMSKAFIAGAREHFPGAAISFDRYHVMALCGKACDEVRKAVSREVGGLGRGAMWALRGNAGGLGEEAAELREELCSTYSEPGRALAMREFLQATPTARVQRSTSGRSAHGRSAPASNPS